MVVQKRVSFLDYIFGGCEISLQVAVDFTASNGDPNQQHSLHSQSGMNQYIQAISSVGAILEQYDSDRKYPVYGFGGQLFENMTKASHCFALNGNIFNPECLGIQGVLNTYRNSIFNAKLHGPTKFASILEQFNSYCRYKSAELSQYN